MPAACGRVTVDMARQLAHVSITFIVFIALYAVNGAVFAPLEHTLGINWVFLPAGIRLLATLLFGFAGFVGLLLAGIYLNFEYYVFQDDVRAIGGALAGSLGPYIAYLFAKHWYNLGPRLKNLTAGRLLFTGLLCGCASPVFHHALLWVQTGLMDWAAFAAMTMGDILGVLVVLYLAKGLIALTDPRDVSDYHS